MPQSTCRPAHAVPTLLCERPIVSEAGIRISPVSRQSETRACEDGLVSARSVQKVPVRTRRHSLLFGKPIGSASNARVYVHPRTGHMSASH